jgi:hypothetical protein
MDDSDGTNGSCDIRAIRVIRGYFSLIASKKAHGQNPQAS